MNDRVRSIIEDEVRKQLQSDYMPTMEFSHIDKLKLTAFVLYQLNFINEKEFENVVDKINAGVDKRKSR